VIVVKGSLIREDSKSTKSVWCLCCNQERGFLSCSNIVNSFVGCEGSGPTLRFRGEPL